MAQSNTSRTKHRPYLSESSIRFLYDAALAARNETTEAAIAYSEIAALAIKLDVGKLKGSYTATPRTSIEDSLGMIETVDPLVYKKTNYARYLAEDPKLTQSNIVDAIEYKERVLKETLTEEENTILNESW